MNRNYKGRGLIHAQSAIDVILSLPFIKRNKTRIEWRNSGLSMTRTAAKDCFAVEQVWMLKRESVDLRIKKW